jgi:hypothetical protein
MRSLGPDSASFRARTWTRRAHAAPLRRVGTTVHSEELVAWAALPSVSLLFDTVVDQEVTSTSRRKG